MRGVIILRDNYVYEGDITGNVQHGAGKIVYVNNDTYEGKFTYGKFDGYGKYTYNDGSSYTGYFSYGMYTGNGTYEDKNIVLCGEWRNDFKHGVFFKTKKKEYKSTRQLWVDNICITEDSIQYMTPEVLQTPKSKCSNKCLTNLNNNDTKLHEKKCITCLENIADSANNLCGHICMCYSCLLKVDECPICRCPINLVLKLYVS